MLHSLWAHAWMQFSGLGIFGRFASRMATWGAPPYKAREFLADMGRNGYVAPTATILHRNFRMGSNCFVGDRTIIYQAPNGGTIEFADQVRIIGSCTFETGDGGNIKIGALSRLHPGCFLMAYNQNIYIGEDVGISVNCCFYPHNHGTRSGQSITTQGLESDGPIIIGDGAWVGAGVIVLSGVKIGSGAVIGAGAVVTCDIPEGAIAAGVPARVIKMRGQKKIDAGLPRDG